MKRKYKDVNGKDREIVYVKDQVGLVGYRKSEDGKCKVYSPAQLWTLEDGSTVQIPVEAWEFCGISYKDVRD